MDAQVTVTRTPAAEIFRKLSNGDPEGAIRDTLHHFVLDPLLDSAFDHIRGGSRPSTGQESLPPPAAPALPTAVGDVPAADVAALRAENEQLRTQLEELRSANRGFADTIARLSREAQGRRKERQDREKADAMDRAIEHEDASPYRDLIGIDEVCGLVQIPKRTIGHLRAQKRFPEPSGRRGKANVWRRQDVENWLKEQTRPPAEPGDELLDTQAVARLVGCSQPTLNKRINLKQFPAHTQRRGLRHLWRRGDVDAWLAARPCQSATQPGDVTGRSRPPQSTAPTPKLCGTCADAITLGRRTMCRSEFGPKRNTAITPEDGCDHHRRPPAAPYRSTQPDARKD